MLRKENTEDGSLAKPAFGVYPALMVSHAVENGGQPQPSSFAGFLGGKKWFENMWQNFGSDTAAVITDNQNHKRTRSGTGEPGGGGNSE